MKNKNVSYVLAIVNDGGFEYIIDECSNEELRFNDLKSAREAKSYLDCPEGVVILKENRTIIE